MAQFNISGLLLQTTDIELCVCVSVTMCDYVSVYNLYRFSDIQRRIMARPGI